MKLDGFGKVGIVSLLAAGIIGCKSKGDFDFGFTLRSGEMASSMPHYNTVFNAAMAQGGSMEVYDLDGNPTYRVSAGEDDGVPYMIVSLRHEEGWGNSRDTLKQPLVNSDLVGRVKDGVESRRIGNGEVKKGHLLGRR